MTIYRIELLFPENMSEELQESIEKIIKESPEPALPNMILRLHKERLRYIPVIEFSAIHGVSAKKKEREIFDYLSGRVEVKRGRSRFEIFLNRHLTSHRSRQVHCFWPANVFELDEVRTELELIKSDSFLRLENEEDVELVKKIDLWYSGESNAKSLKYRDNWNEMSEEEKRRATWEYVLIFVRHGALAYEKILNTYRKFGKLFWFTFYYSD
jgi:hypothetical protein